MVGVGILFSYSLGALMYWRLVACLPPVLYIVLATGLHFIPESPIWLLAHKGDKEAHLALQWLRNDDSIDEEFNSLKSIKEKQDHGLTLMEALKNLWSRADVRNPFFIVTTNFFLVIFTGPIVIIYFSVEIFISAGINVSEFMAAILTAVFRVCGGLVGILCVQQLPRVRLAMTSVTTMSLAMTTMGTVFYLKSLGFQHITLDILPVVSLTVYNFSYGAGEVAIRYCCCMISPIF